MVKYLSSPMCLINIFSLALACQKSMEYVYYTITGPIKGKQPSTKSAMIGCYIQFGKTRVNPLLSFYLIILDVSEGNR